MNNKTVIDLGAPSGNIFEVLATVITDVKGIREDTKECTAELQRYVNLGSYDAIIAEIERELGDKVEFINKP